MDAKQYSPIEPPTKFLITVDRDNVTSVIIFNITTKVICSIDTFRRDTIQNITQCIDTMYKLYGSNIDIYLDIIDDNIMGSSITMKFPGVYLI
jgi:hypothetical protein